VRVLRREWPLLVVCLLAAAGVVVCAVHDPWSKGLYLVAVALLLGAGLRLVLPLRRAGLLAVRSRFLDVATLLLTGLAVGGLTYSLAHQG